MVYRKLQLKDLTETNKKNISKLIFDTDAHISHAMFNSEENAVEILSALLSDGKDAMFCWENIFVSLNREKVVGLILWHRGPFKWGREHIIEVSKKQKVALSKHFELVCKEYFETYNDKSLEGVVSLIDVCVQQEWRNLGIGSEMLTAFLDQIYAPEYELYCLEDNVAAMRIYEKHGFEVATKQKAFTINHSGIYSVRMKKR